MTRKTPQAIDKCTKCLAENYHWSNLNDDSITDRSLAVNLADLCVAVVEIQQRYLLMYLLQRNRHRKSSTVNNSLT